MNGSTSKSTFGLPWKALLLLALTSACRNPTPENTAAAQGLQVTAAPTVDAIRAVLALPELSQSALEGLLAISLSHDDSRGAGSPWSKATPASGPFKSVSMANGVGVELQVREDTEVVFSRFIEAKLIPNFDGRQFSHPIPDPFYTHHVTYPNKRQALYTFNKRTDRLLSVAISPLQ